MRALVTGAAGFLGANLVRHLAVAGHEVTALSRSHKEAWRLEKVASEVQVLGFDLRDTVAIERMVATAKPEWVFHLAANGAYSWQTDVETMISVNIRATAALLAAARKADVQAFVSAGSSSEYGRKTHAPRENEWLEPNSYYAVTKAAGSHLTALAAAEGLPAVTLRLYSIYGPWEDPGRLIPALIREATHGRLPPLVGAETARDFVYVDDCCEALLRAAQHDAPGGAGAILNIGSGSQTRLDELVEIARTALGIEARPQWGCMDQRSWDTSVWVSDPRAAFEHLGWQANTGLAEGLARTSAWLQAHPTLWERYGVAATASARHGQT
ncbi:MAG TPA: NAD-dependent epimerase/dehydratase family protein [Solirubrobacteraceae bacterium]|nr:NAD-dependent epimerase/dehydratase family protein [Solirubrobacteraceae bacterium]